MKQVEEPGRSPYDAAFYAEGRGYAAASARRMVPRILELVPARSVVDVGCGVGSWLAAFAAAGAEVHGVDGDHVDRAALEIPAERFIAHDLGQPLELGWGFDLALSLEVAEHLPPAAGKSLVGALCRLAPVVVFSAAVPTQGGVEHVNEQWQDHWAAMFALQGYRCVDLLRDEFWADPEVSWWYAQNALIYVAEYALPRHPRLAASALAGLPRRLVHPTLVERNLHRRRLQDALLQLVEHVPDGATVLVADGGQLQAAGPRVARHFTWRPFLERDGEYHGAPADGAQALAELQRMRAAGADHLALVWPAFWWLDHYAGLGGFLAGCRRSFASDEVVLYDLGAG